MRTLRFAALTAATGVAVLLAGAGCNLNVNYLDDGFTRPDPVNDVRIERGGSGNVTVRGDASIAGVDVRRSVRYRGGGAPAETARVEGASLVLDLDCGPNCSVTYEVRLPAGATVRGENNSGNVKLSDVGAVDVRVHSGTIDLDGATGTVTLHADSGNIMVRRVSADLTATASSGTIDARELAGAANRVEVDSGDVTVDYAGTGTLRAHADSGNVTITVPGGACRVAADSGSGRATVEVATSTTGRCSVEANSGSGNVRVSAR